MVQALLLFAALASPQDEIKIAATLREAPDGGAEKRPALVCEGTSDLPEGSRLDLRLFFGEAAKGPEMGRKAVEIRQGRFACEFAVYTPPRNLAGPHSICVTFDPHLQRQSVLDALGNKALPVRAEARLQVGTSDEADQARATWGRKLVAEVETVVSIAEREAETRYQQDRAAGKHDPKEWERFAAEAAERAEEILRRVIRVPEFRALWPACDAAFDELHEIALHYVRSCARVLNNPDHHRGPEVLREARRLLRGSKQRLLWSVFPPQGDSKLLTGMGEDALKILKDSMEADAEARPRARRKFQEAILALDSRAPATFHENIINLATDAGPFFEALGTDKARPILEGLERQFREVLEDFKKLK